ncbi:hypothetical protein LR48_Vigan03g141300 [Vigna angularis]|uniref:Uncharacterized protein n=1 Tax=Phaseolus angularis TaxID=3914 RepID=A0A0L9U5J2_PHAAN|nr:hypothetical protein LR48_Vigan03g141300 [Vigna angularis]
MKKADNEEKLVYQDSMHEINELYLGKPVKFKNRLWIKASTDGCYVIKRLLMNATEGHLLMDADEDEKDLHLLMDADEKDSHLLMDARRFK